MSDNETTRDHSQDFIERASRLGIKLKPAPKGGAYTQLVKDVSAMMQKENLEHPYNPQENVHPDTTK